MIQIDINTVALMIGIIATLIGGALWVMGLVNKISIRVTNHERDVEDIEKRVKKVEEKTDYKYQEAIVTDIIVKALNSKEVKETLKSQIRDVILHIDRNLSVERAQVFDLLFEKMNNLELIIKEKHNEKIL